MKRSQNLPVFCETKGLMCAHIWQENTCVQEDYMNASMPGVSIHTHLK